MRGHTDKHRIELIVEPRQQVKKYVKCKGCGESPIQEVRYKCDNCFDFDFCDKCFISSVIEKRELKTIYSTSHKLYHTFTKFLLTSTQPPKDSQVLESLVEGGGLAPDKPKRKSPAKR